MQNKQLIFPTSIRKNELKVGMDLIEIEYKNKFDGEVETYFINPDKLKELDEECIIKITDLKILKIPESKSDYITFIDREELVFSKIKCVVYYPETKRTQHRKTINCYLGSIERMQERYPSKYGTKEDNPENLTRDWTKSSDTNVNKIRPGFFEDNFDGMF